MPPGVTGGDDTTVVEKLCSTCHVLPPPDCEPKHLWPAKIEEMYYPEVFATTKGESVTIERE